MQIGMGADYLRTLGMFGLPRKTRRALLAMAKGPVEPAILAVAKLLPEGWGISGVESPYGDSRMDLLSPEGVAVPLWGFGTGEVTEGGLSRARYALAQAKGFRPCACGSGMAWSACPGKRRDCF